MRGGGGYRSRGLARGQVYHGRSTTSGPTRGLLYSYGTQTKSSLESERRARRDGLASRAVTMNNSPPKFRMPFQGFQRSLSKLNQGDDFFKLAALLLSGDIVWRMVGMTMARNGLPHFAHSHYHADQRAQESTSNEESPYKPQAFPRRVKHVITWNHLEWRSSASAVRHFSSLRMSAGLSTVPAGHSATGPRL